MTTATWTSRHSRPSGGVWVSSSWRGSGTCRRRCGRVSHTCSTGWNARARRRRTSRRFHAPQPHDRSAHACFTIASTAVCASSRDQRRTHWFGRSTVSQEPDPQLAPVCRSRAGMRANACSTWSRGRGEQRRQCRERTRGFPAHFPFRMTRKCFTPPPRSPSSPRQTPHQRSAEPTPGSGRRTPPVARPIRGAIGGAGCDGG